jgi:hypothetical protein
MEIDFFKAAEDIRKAWCKGRLGAVGEPEGPVCARGAILRQMGGPDRLFLPAEERDKVSRADAVLAKVIREQFPERICDAPKRIRDEVTDAFTVVIFNNHPETTAEEVATMMEKAAVS